MGRFQAWLRHLNAGGHDIFIGMNPMRAATNRRKKADVSEVRRLQLDLVTGEELLAMYRQRGKAEGHMGELMSVVNPALSSSPRPKRHNRGRPVENPGSGIDAFACNETRLLLAVFGYQIMHAQRAVLERATGTGWSLRLLLERVLRAPARIRRAAAKAWHPCARNRDTLALSADRSPKTLQNGVLAPHSWAQVIRSFVRVSRIARNRAPRWGLVNNSGLRQENHAVDRTFDPDAFVRRVGERLVEQFNEARAATTPATVGSAMEQPVRKQLEQILPRGLAVGSGFVIDSYGGTSRQTDIVLYERDICPVFSINDTPETTYYPCECVVAVGEVKSALHRDALRDAFKKTESVKRLRRNIVREEVPDPHTGEGWPIYRSYGGLHDTLHNGGLRDSSRLPGELAEIFGFVLTGESRLTEDTLATTFRELTRAGGDALAPNLLVTLNGIALSWGNVTDEQPEVVKMDGTYVLSVPRGRPLRWQHTLSAQTAECMGVQRGDGFRFLVRRIRDIHYRGRTSAISSLDRYFRSRDPRSGEVCPLPKDPSAEAQALG